MKALMVTAAICVLFGIALWDREPEVQVRRSSDEPPTNQVIATGATLELTAELTRLRRRIAQLEAHEHERVPHAKKSQAEGSDTTPNYEDSEVVANLRAQAIEKVRSVDRSFAVESRDDVWASEMEQNIHQVFAENTFGETMVTAVGCKSSLCRIEAVHEGRDSQDDFEAVRRHVKGNFYLQKVAPSDAGSGGKYQTIVYFVRSGHERDNALYALMYSE